MPEYQTFASILPVVPTDVLARINNAVKVIDVDKEFRDLTYMQVTRSYLSIKRDFHGL
jgi:hypothetical protein